PRAVATPYSASQKARCALCINKIGLVQMPGEHGTRIEDDVRITALSSGRQYLTATVYEDGTYKLHVQLDCGGHLSGDPQDSPCSRSLSVTAWIDFNDNGLDESESRLLQRAWSGNDVSTGIYDFDTRIPRIDDRTTKAGPHRMIITIAPSEEYQRECGAFPYKETREYTVDVIPRERYTAPPTTPFVCPLSIAKIILVIMAGEKGTEIRDDKPMTSLSPNYINQHHMAVTLFEHTVYLLRIQLDCSSQLKTELTPTGCNLGQDVNVWVDLNDDGRFDESEVGAPYRWPVTSYMAEALDATPTSVVPHNVPCSPDVGKLILVVMAGEHKTQIRDDQSTRAQLTGNTRIHQHLSIVLYEDTVYLLRIQLECTGSRDSYSAGNNCNLPHDVAAWLDLNNDGTFSDTENAAPYRWPLTSYIPQGVYDLQIYIPNIDGAKTKSGPHRLRLDVTLNEQYRQKCGKSYYRETREYNVTIVKKNMKQTVDIGGPYLTLSDSVCSKAHGKIVLVIAAGEKGTHIRDDTPINTIIREDQNRHHMGITYYDNTIYRLRIQLDCDQRSSRAPFRIQCNLAYDVNVYIDLNSDGRFDESESRVPHRWPLRSTMTIGIYDLEIPVPSIDGVTTKGGSHIMRVVVKSSDEYNKKCGRSDYSETREYTVNIIPKEAYSAAHIYSASNI
ncbi:unnamed protein product, partial [Rotaria sp. Silwood2]